MNASSRTKFAIGVTVGAVVVFVAAFIPWGLHSSPLVKVVTTSIEGERPASGGPLVIHITFPKTMTGWNSYISVGALKLPNWVVVVAAGALMALSWLKAFLVWDAPAVVPLALAAYGLLHAALVYVLQVGSRLLGTVVEGGVTVVEGGVIEEGGALLTAVAFVGILVVLVQQLRSPRPAGPA